MNLRGGKFGSRPPRPTLPICLSSSCLHTGGCASMPVVHTFGLCQMMPSAMGTHASCLPLPVSYVMGRRCFGLGVPKMTCGRAFCCPSVAIFRQCQSLVLLSVRPVHPICPSGKSSRWLLPLSRHGGRSRDDDDAAHVHFAPVLRSALSAPFLYSHANFLPLSPPFLVFYTLGY